MNAAVFNTIDLPAGFKTLPCGELKPVTMNKSDKIRIRLTDNPANYKGLFIDIHKIEVCGSVQGWRELEPLVNRVDVLTLTNGRDIVLAEFEADRGQEEKVLQVNLKLGNDNCLVAENHEGLKRSDNRKSREKYELQMLSSRVCPVNIHYELSDEQDEDIILDMDVAKSVLRFDGSFYLRPVIKHISDPYTGVRGRFPGDTRVLVYATDFVRIYSTYTDVYGNFLIRGMAPGEYSFMACLPAGNARAKNGRCIYTASGSVHDGVITELEDWRWE